MNRKFIMGSSKKVLYSFYEKIKNIKLFSSVIAYVHISYQRWWGKASSLELGITSPQQVKIAFICDEMTWQNYRHDVSACFITPRKWKKNLASFSPDILFCESAWSGIDKYKDSWRGQIYKTNRFLFENRKVLFEIVAYCKQQGIRTVFWNKEDPTYFDNPLHNFSDTALHFDNIFTTATECVDSYKELGHGNVRVMMFGYSPEIFYPPSEEKRENIAVFAGSWFADQQVRCAELIKIFEEVLEAGIELQIYDRQWQSGKMEAIFPAKYRPYVRPGIPYQQLGELYRRAKYVINVNTVKDSTTMFARRVFEAMACKAVIISNDSPGLRQRFGRRIWFVGEAFCHDKENQYRDENFEYVKAYHSNKQNFKQILNVVSQDSCEKGDS